MKSIVKETMLGMMLLIILPIHMIAQNQACSQGNNANWYPNFRHPGAQATQVNVLASDSNYLYASGPYSAYGGANEVRSLARFDGVKWEKIGGDFICTSCGYGQQHALLLNDNSDIYVGGFFEGGENPGSSNVYSSNIIRWNAGSGIWEALGKGVKGRVNALAMDGDTLYVAGELEEVYNGSDTIEVGRIARYFLASGLWDSIPGGRISNVQTFLSGDIYALEIGNNHELFVGGAFDRVGNIPVNSIARWVPGQGWGDMNGGLVMTGTTFSNTGTVQALDFDHSTGKLYVGGQFGQYLSQNNHLAIWDSSIWSIIPGIGTPTSGGSWFTIGDVMIDESTQKLYVGGSFNYASGSSAGNRIAIYDLTNNLWSQPDNGITLGGGPNAITSWQGKVYIGGDIRELDNIKASNIVGWDGNNWDLLGEGLQTYGGEIYSVLQVGDTIYAGGLFSHLGGTAAHSLARWTPQTGWEELGGGVWRTGVSGYVYTLKKEGNYLYVGGRFDQVGAFTSAHAIARLDLNSQTWTTIDGGITGGSAKVNVIEIYGGMVVAGGFFTQAGSVNANNLAILVGGAWDTLGNPNAEVLSLQNQGDSLLYVGGTFSQVASNPVSKIAALDGTNWIQLGQGLTTFGARAETMAIHPLTGELAVGGFFQKVKQLDGTELNVNHLAVWDGNTWMTPDNTLGNGTNKINNLAYDATGILYLSGEFEAIGGIFANGIARYEATKGWGKMGDGLIYSLEGTGTVSTHSLTVNDSFLVVSGSFYHAGEYQATKLARYRLDDFGGTPPDADFTWSIDTANQMLVFQADSNAGDQILWDFGTGETSTAANPLISLPDSGEYQVTLVISNHCGSDTSIQIISVPTLTSVNQELNLKWKVYPNPSEGVIHLEWEITGSNYLNIRIMDLHGREIGEAVVHADQRHWRTDLSERSAGIYLLEISDQKRKRYLQKLILR